MGAYPQPDPISGSDADPIGFPYYVPASGTTIHSLAAPLRCRPWCCYTLYRWLLLSQPSGILNLLKSLFPNQQTYCIKMLLGCQEVFKLFVGLFLSVPTGFEPMFHWRFPPYSFPCGPLRPKPLDYDTLKNSPTF